jgi:signal transduction histidine kinase
MNSPHHKLLERQLRRVCDAAGNLPEQFRPLLEAISQAYTDADSDRLMIERSMELMSQELNDRNEQLRSELLDRQQARDELQRKSEEQHALIEKLEQAHNQLLQSEKMASIGQLAAGVAHEINNPIGFVSSNLRSLRAYVDGLFDIIATYERHEAALGIPARQEILQCRKQHEFEYLQSDVIELLDESADGAQRVKQIVQDLKDFSHVGEPDWQFADLHKGLESTINIAHNEIKYVAEITRNYGVIPDVECLASQLNQVFMNILVNAAHANKDGRGHIGIRTALLDESQVCVEISDDGVGIPPENLTRIFDPFFTTKPVGKGTGLGLSLSYGIVAKHNGRIDVTSEVGVGTTFRVVLPIRQAPAPRTATETATVA